VRLGEDERTKEKKNDDDQKGEKTESSSSSFAYVTLPYLLGQVTSPLGGVDNLVEENGEVEGETKTNRVSRGKLAKGSILSSLVSQHGLLGSLLALGAGLELRKVTVVIALHLEVEDLGLSVVGGRDEVLVQEFKNRRADLLELALDDCTVLLDALHVLGVTLGLFLGLDAADDTPGGTAGTDNVLVGYGKEVALLNRKLGLKGLLRGLLHFLNHLVIALSLHKYKGI